MAMIVNTTPNVISARNALDRATSNAAEALRNLSTGKRVNQAADDNAGLAIATRMDTQILTANRAIKNATDGMAMISTAEAGLSGVLDMSQRIRELSVQAANGTASASDLETMQSEVAQLLSEIERVGSSAEFNGSKLFTGMNPISVFKFDDGDSTTVARQICTGTLGQQQICQHLRQ